MDCNKIGSMMRSPQSAGGAAQPKSNLAQIAQDASTMAKQAGGDGVQLAQHLLQGAGNGQQVQQSQPTGVGRNVFAVA